MENFGFFFQLCCDRKQNKLWRLLKFGEERINHEFNLLKLIQTVRNMKLILKKELLNPKKQFIIENSDYNVIDID